MHPEIQVVILLHSIHTLPTYGGIGYVKTHLGKFHNIYKELSAYPNVMAKFFPHTLTGITLEWYQYLISYSIESFD